jgi:hypothetical protein
MNPITHFLRGMASAFVLFPELPKPMSNEEAIASDWQAVGDDIRTVIRKLEKEGALDTPTEPGAQ